MAESLAVRSDFEWPLMRGTGEREKKAAVSQTGRSPLVVGSHHNERKHPGREESHRSLSSSDGHKSGVLISDTCEQIPVNLKNRNLIQSNKYTNVSNALMYQTTLITLFISIRTLPVRCCSLRVTADWLERPHKMKRAWQPARSPSASKTFQQCGCSHGPPAQRVLLWKLS